MASSPETHLPFLFFPRITLSICWFACSVFTLESVPSRFPSAPQPNTLLHSDMDIFSPCWSLKVDSATPTAWMHGCFTPHCSLPVSSILREICLTSILGELLVGQAWIISFPLELPNKIWMPCALNLHSYSQLDSEYCSGTSSSLIQNLLHSVTSFSVTYV